MHDMTSAEKSKNFERKKSCKMIAQKIIKNNQLISKPKTVPDN